MQDISLFNIKNLLGDDRWIIDDFGFHSLITSYAALYPN